MTLAYPIAGIDVAKHTLDVAVLDAEQNCTTWSLASDQVVLRKLARRLIASGVRLVVLEATGGLEVGVTYVNDKAEPQFMAQMDQWSIGGDMDASLFKAGVPDKAKKVPFGK